MVAWNRGIFFAVFLLVAQCLDIDGTIWEHESYLRTLDLSRSYVKETCIIEAVNVDNKPHSEYFFTLNDGFNATGDISVMSVSLEDLPLVVDAQEIEAGVYKIEFPAPIAPRSRVNFKVRYVYVNLLDPVPKSFEMSEVQTLLLKLNKFVYSPYVTNRYTLTFTGILKGQEMLLEYLSGMSEITINPPELEARIEGQSLVYGPLLSVVSPYTLVPMGLLYEHNRPLASVTNLERSLWIPASGIKDIAIEEYYELTNRAAKLQGGFLRLEWMKGRFEATINHWALSTLQFLAPESSDFRDYYYTDLVGVVSTHKRAHNSLVLQPRFPIFGGWKYNFTLGWNDDLSKYVHKTAEDDTFIARFPLLNTLRDTTYQNVTLNFYLPEEAEFLGVASAVNYQNIVIGEEASYLDVYKGHVKVSLNYQNLFDDLSRVDVLIKYKYTPFSYWRKITKIWLAITFGLVPFSFYDYSK